jgi:hypothetical protein
VRRLLLEIALSLLVVGALPASAAAADCSAAPDAAAIDQYCELLPTADGTGLTTTARGNGPRLSDVLPADVVAGLRHAGPEGRALLLLPAPYPGRPDSPPLGTEGILKGRLAAEPGVGQVPRALAEALRTGGMPAVLTWILGLTAFVGTAAVVTRRRRRTGAV